MKNKFVIYALKHPETHEIRYVGKSVSGASRLSTHIYKARRSPTTAVSYWIAKLLSNGLKPEFAVLEEFESKEALNESEVRWISNLRQSDARLLNHTNGGDGCLGYSPSKQTREIKSKQSKEMWLQEGYRENHSAKLKACWDDPNYKKEMCKINQRSWDRLSKSERDEKLIAIRLLAITRRKPITDQNGDCYNSITHAAESLGLQRSHIQQVLKGNRTHTGGYKFQFIETAVTP